MENTADIVEENALLREQLNAKNQRIAQLESLLKQVRQQHFGRSSEKLSAEQIQLFDEAEQAEEEADVGSETTTIASHTRRKAKRLSIPADLPREELVYDLPEADKVCPHDDTPLKEIGAETHEQLDIIFAQIKVLKHIRKKYACPCCEQYLITASKPKQPIEKSIAAPGLLSYISVSKYQDALPLYRQVEIFKRIGIELDRSTLANWMIRCGELVQPLINRIHEQLLAQSVLHMDETPVQVLSESG